jgi:hypothetical protein
MWIGFFLDDAFEKFSFVRFNELVDHAVRVHVFVISV